MHPVYQEKLASYDAVLDPRLSNCWLYVKSVFKDLPSAATIKAGASPAFGDIAVFDYNGLQHFAVVVSMGYGTFTITESNFGRHAITSREVSFADPHLKGFYSIK